MASTQQESETGRGAAQGRAAESPVLPPIAKPQQEHAWLSRLIGDWDFEGEGQDEKGAVSRTTGIERVRSLGGLWIMAEGEGDMPGLGSVTTVMTLGYDPRQGYLGTWIGSMMTHLWVYRGTLDESGRTLTLESQGPSMMDPARLVPYRDAITIESDDHRIMTSQAPTDDGKWITFMTMNYRRR